MSLTDQAKIKSLVETAGLTQSEIAKALALRESSVKEQVDALIGAGLIEKKEEGRKWKYFSLTPKGKHLLHPTEDVRILIVLGAFVFSALAGVHWLYRYYSAPVTAAAPMALRAAEAVQSGFPWNGFLAYLLWLCLLVAGYFYLRKRPK